MRRRIGVAVVTLVVAAVCSSAAVANTISATCSSGGRTQTCDSSRWYPSAVSVTWQASPPPDSSSCPLGIVNHQNKDEVTTISCSATWQGSPTVTLNQQYTLHIEISTPTTSGAPTRPPDSDGWYNHPVIVQFHGTAFSGIASCLSITYAGSPALNAAVAGSCTDRAGKTTFATSSRFEYDATPPGLSVTQSSGDRVAALSWSIADIAPVTEIKVERQPGLRGKRPSLLYHGSATSFRDRRVHNGIRYRYTLTATDAAGNATTDTVLVRPGLRLLSPARRMRLTAPPLLVWTAVRRATYYNVQVFRGSKKVLSTWPSPARLQLAPRWSFRRKSYRLRPGTYRWYVWPGFGPRAAAHYGHVIGSRTFVIAR